MPALRKCRNCGKPFQGRGRQILCSNECKKQDRNLQERARYANDEEYRKDKIARATQPIKPPRFRNCLWCGKPFATKTRRKYCDDACQQKYWGQERKSNPEVRHKKLAGDKAAYERKKSTPEGRERLREQSRKANAKPETVRRLRKYWRIRRSEDPGVREKSAAASRLFAQRFRELHGISPVTAHRRFNPNYRVASNLRSRLRAYLRLIKAPKAGKTMELVGLTKDKLQKWIERQFEPGMNWDNYAPGGWHIDHVRPLSSFDLRDSRQQYTASNWRNLRPMWGPGDSGNLSKQRRYTAQDQEQWVKRMRELGWKGELFLKVFAHGGDGSNPGGTIQPAGIQMKS